MSTCVVSASSMSSGRMGRTEDWPSRPALRNLVPGSRSIRLAWLAAVTFPRASGLAEQGIRCDHFGRLILTLATPLKAPLNHDLEATSLPSR